MRTTGHALAIVAITLALDFVLTATVFSGPARTLRQADAANWSAYIPAPYHHDLRPDMNAERVWGNIVYRWQTDRYGLRTGRCAPGDEDKGRRAIFVIGDSFTEAPGSSYEQSFVGLMACEAAMQGSAVWNLGVTSYSPAIYHLKIRSAAERLGIRPAEIYVFLDLSDIDDDANVYRVLADGTVHLARPPPPSLLPFDLARIMIENFSTFRLAHDLLLTSSFVEEKSLGRDRARWTIDPELMTQWGRRGLEVAAGNLEKVVDECRDWDCSVTLVVYPWPDNVAAHDRDSIQVTYWRDWAAGRGVRFVNGFEPFFRVPSDEALARYFIAGDVHFTEPGNRLLFEEVRKAVGGRW